MTFTQHITGVRYKASSLFPIVYSRHKWNGLQFKTCGSHNAFGNNWPLNITLIKPWTSIQLPGNDVWEISLGYNMASSSSSPISLPSNCYSYLSFFQSCLVKSDTFSPSLIYYLPSKWQKKNSHAYSTKIYFFSSTASPYYPVTIEEQMLNLNS